jgi:hypothetical protein
MGKQTYKVSLIHFGLFQKKFSGVSTSIRDWNGISGKQTQSWGLVVSLSVKQ